MHFLYRLFLIVLTLLLPGSVFAQSQSLSVTPPLFQLSVEPGDIWQSTINVVNSNEFPLTVYAEVVNFVPEGEAGLGKFMPVLRDGEVKATLAEWIEVAPGPYVIERQQTGSINFFVDVPKDAAPGGHFAAILISTEPPATDEPLALVTTQTVASLFFLRVEGDVIERADIREFTVLDRSIELPEAEFSLRFENKGNVHLQPRGDIVIMNMWGKERGVIPINHDTHFGNVLPASIRDFQFSWKGERSLADIGRYKAIATLAYGEDGVKSVTSTTYFWVIPIKGALITLAILVGFVLAVTWMIRLYIRRMLVLAGVDPDAREEVQVPTRAMTRTKDLVLHKRVAEPIRSGAADFRSRMSGVSEFVEVIGVIVSFIMQYRRFFIALLLIIAGFVGIVLYIGEVGKSETDYEVTIDEGDSTRTLTDDEVENVRNTN